MPSWEQKLFDPSPGFLGEIVRAPLWLFAGIYRMGVKMRLDFYRRGWFHSHKIDIPVISVGNLTLGGSGKTPVVIWLAKKLAESGFKPAVSIRGFGARKEKEIFILNNPQLDISVREVGDEAMLIFKKLKNVPVIVGKDRVEAGKRASELGAQILILDDGYQHIRLKRDVNILLIDARRSIFKEKLFPRGRLREPISQVSRAQIIIFTRSDGAFPSWAEEVKKINPSAQFFQMRLVPKDYEELCSKSAYAFSGICDPEDFFWLAESCKIKLVGKKAFQDHHFFTNKELKNMLREAKSKNAQLLLTTEKDIVRIENFNPELSLVALRVEPEFFGEESKLLSIVLNLIKRESKR